MQKFASCGLSFIALILLAILGEQLQDFRVCGLNNKEKDLSKCFKLERTERTARGLTCNLRLNGL